MKTKKNTMYLGTANEEKIVAKFKKKLANFKTLVVQFFQPEEKSKVRLGFFWVKKSRVFNTQGARLRSMVFSTKSSSGRE